MLFCDIIIVTNTKLLTCNLPYKGVYTIGNQVICVSIVNFSPTLYIGEHLHGLYALPSLVDQNLVKITISEVGPLLLEGPESSESPRAYPEYKIAGHNYNVHEGR